MGKDSNLLNYKFNQDVMPMVDGVRVLVKKGMIISSASMNNTVGKYGEPTKEGVTHCVVNKKLVDAKGAAKLTATKAPKDAPKPEVKDAPKTETKDATKAK